jgi:hypothetical protein
VTGAGTLSKFPFDCACGQRIVAEEIEFSAGRSPTVNAGWVVCTHECWSCGRRERAAHKLAVR